MAVVFTETCEAAGFDLGGAKWTGENTDVGCVADEDYLTSNIGSPVGWDSKCLRILADDDGENAYEDFDWGADIPIAYTRIEIYTEDLSGIGNNTEASFVHCWTQGWGLNYRINIRREDPNWFFRLMDVENSTNYDSTPILENTKYTVEIKWDNTNDKMTWRLNEVAQDTDVAISADRDCGRWAVGIKTYQKAADVCIDNFTVDDADWPGISGAGGSNPWWYWNILARNRWQPRQERTIKRYTNLPWELRRK